MRTAQFTKNCQHPGREIPMFKYAYLSPLALLAVAICLGGSSCHDPKVQDNSLNNPALNGGPNRTGAGMVPRTQIQPRMNRTQ